MGWMFTKARYFKDNGRIDIKKEAEHLIDRNRFDILKSINVGSTVYMALREKDSSNILAAIVLTKTESRGLAYPEFGSEIMSEGEGPVEANCPASILNMLSAPSNEYAEKWRSRCRQNNQKRKLADLPENSIVQTQWPLSDGSAYERKMQKRKHGKRCRWFCVDAPSNYVSSRTLNSLGWEIASIGNTAAQN